MSDYLLMIWISFVLQYCTGSTECTVKCVCDWQRITLSFLTSLLQIVQIWCLQIQNTTITYNIRYLWAKGKMLLTYVQRTFYLHPPCPLSMPYVVMGVLVLIVMIDYWWLMTFNVIKLFIMIMIIKTVMTVKQIPPMFENWNGLLDAHFTLTRSRWRHVLWIVCLWKKYFESNTFTLLLNFRDTSDIWQLENCSQWGSSANWLSSVMLPRLNLTRR